MYSPMLVAPDKSISSALTEVTGIGSMLPGRTRREPVTTISCSVSSSVSGSCARSYCPRAQQCGNACQQTYGFVHDRIPAILTWAFRVEPSLAYTKTRE